MSSKISDFVHIPPGTRATFIVFTLLIVAFIVIFMIELSGPVRYKDECTERVLLFYSELSGRVERVDTNPHRGVWTFVANHQLNELYGFNTDESIQVATYGDSVYKPSQSDYGWVIKDSVERRWVKLINRYDCNIITPERIEKILQTKDYFKR